MDKRWGNVHCLHIAEMLRLGGMRGRYCCWCDFKQTRVDDEPIHGPNYFGDDRFDYHWEPSSAGVCPRDGVEQAKG